MDRRDSSLLAAQHLQDHRSLVRERRSRHRCEIDARQQRYRIVGETPEEVPGAESGLPRRAPGVDVLDEESGLVREPDSRSRPAGDVRGGDVDLRRRIAVAGAQGPYFLEIADS